MSENVLHRLIDSAAGRANIGAHEADALHDEITPGYSAKPLTDDEKSTLAALLEKAQVQQARESADAAAAVA